MEDVVELRNNLIARQSTDEQNVSIMGRSYGGFMTLLFGFFEETVCHV